MGIRLIFLNYVMCVIIEEVTQKGKPSSRRLRRFELLVRSRRKIHAVVNHEEFIDSGSNSKKWPDYAAKKILVVNA